MFKQIVQMLPQLCKRLPYNIKQCYLDEWNCSFIIDCFITEITLLTPVFFRQPYWKMAIKAHIDIISSGSITSYFIMLIVSTCSKLHASMCKPAIVTVLVH